MANYSRRKQRSLVHALIGAVALTGALVPPVSAQETSVIIAFVDSPLEFLVQSVADATRKRFIIDAQVRASVSLEMDAPQGGEQLLETLRAVLRTQGLTMQQVGNDLRIMPERAAATAAGEPDRVISAAPRPAAPASKPNRNQLVARPARPAAPDWLDEIRLQPVFSNGLQRGYRAYPGGTRVEFTRLGLDVGDLVISVNGRTLDDAAHGQAFYEALAAQSIVVRLERAGRNEYLQLANHYSAP